MLTMPLFLILLLAAVIAVKYGSAKPGPMLLGVLLGLSLASTSIGAPLLGALTDLSSTVVSAVTSAVGGGA